MAAILGFKYEQRHVKRLLIISDHQADCNSPSLEPTSKDLKLFRHEMRKEIRFEGLDFSENANENSIQDLLGYCLGQVDQHQRDRTFIRKAGKKTLVFANNFANFLQAYSGVVEIMKGADQQYGGIAYGTLSILLIVAVNKQRKEELIEATLLDMQREFSRLQILKEIHTSQNIKKYIADAYKLGIEFAMEATRYYSRPSYKRVVEAFTKPPSLRIDIKVSEITKAMIEIQKERATLDSQRIFEVQQKQLETQQKQLETQQAVDGIKEELRDTREQVERKRLGELKVKLLQGNPTPKEILEQYSSAVSGAFKNPGRLRNLNVNDIIQNETYTNWEKYKKSSIMLIHGTTELKRGDYSWLSPATFHFIRHFNDQHRLVLFHCCHDRNFMESDTPFHLVLSSLIFQILEAQPAVLRDGSQYHELLTKVSDPAWQANYPQSAFEVLRQLLSSLPEVYLFLDRIDRIKGSASRFLESLGDLVKNSKNVLKVLLVASSNRQGHPEGKMTQHVLESLEEELGSQRFLRLRLDQK
ncbi:MAG: hypothetical protein Q9195_005658 [Heterodermia aff. obscurata]